MHVCSPHACHHQVCRPGLHITLGIFYQLWCLLEAGCHKLDLELATRTSDRDSFQKYSALLKQLSNLSEKADLTQFLSSLNSVLGDLAIQFPSSDSHPVVQALKGEVQSHAQTLDKLVKLLLHKTQSCSYTCWIYLLSPFHRRERSKQWRQHAVRGSLYIMSHLSAVLKNCWGKCTSIVRPIMGEHLQETMRIDA